MIRRTAARDLAEQRTVIEHRDGGTPAIMAQQAMSRTG